MSTAYPQLIAERGVRGDDPEINFSFAWGLDELGLEELINWRTLRWVVERLYQNQRISWALISTKAASVRASIGITCKYWRAFRRRKQENFIVTSRWTLLAAEVIWSHGGCPRMSSSSSVRYTMCRRG